MTEASRLLLEQAERGELDAYRATIGSVPVGQLNALGKSEAFQRSLVFLAQIAADTSRSPNRRLSALALIGRADSSTRRLEKATSDAAVSALRIEPPRLVIENKSALDADNRKYIASILDLASSDWVVPYAARALVDEEKSDDARASLARLTFDRTDSLVAAFDAIATAAPGSLHQTPGTKDADGSRAKRVIRLLPAIEEQVRKATSDNGDDLSAAFNRLLSALIFRFARPQVGSEGDEDAAAVGAAVLMLASTLVRTRFSISGETEAYKVVGQLKYWLKSTTWPAATRDARARLGQSIREAIALRAQMGKPSRELLAVLVQMSGDRKIVERQLSLISNLPDVPSDVQDWLRAGGRQVAPRFDTQAGKEAANRDLDELIAAAFVRASRLRNLADEDAKSALARLREGLDQNAAALTLTQTVNFARAVAGDVLALAQRRSMSMIGNGGDVVVYEPLRHRGENGQMVDTEFVRIEVPGVERTLPNGSTVVIVEAAVTPAAAKRK